MADTDILTVKPARHKTRQSTSILKGPQNDPLTSHQYFLLEEYQSLRLDSCGRASRSPHEEHGCQICGSYVSLLPSSIQIEAKTTE